MARARGMSVTEATAADRLELARGLLRRMEAGPPAEVLPDDGARVLPFKSTLFQAASKATDDAGRLCQPIPGAPGDPNCELAPIWDLK